MHCCSGRIEESLQHHIPRCRCAPRRSFDQGREIASRGSADQHGVLPGSIAGAGFGVLCGGQARTGGVDDFVRVGLDGIAGGGEEDRGVGLAGVSLATSSGRGGSAECG